MRDVIRTVRSIGAREAIRAVRSRLWSETLGFGLASDLTDLPSPRPPKIPVNMVVVEARGFRGFDEERERTEGSDRLEVEQRQRLCRAGVARLYVAATDDGDAIYAQWLIGSGEQAPLHRVTHRQFPHLTGNETLVEGAYTFVNHRKLGAMAEGMSQLMHIARDEGSNRCLTYVSCDNVPSLRGCANSGFVLDHTRVTRQRFGRRQVSFRPPTSAEREVWDAAVAPRPPVA